MGVTVDEGGSQATFTARLIFELEAALLRHFQVERASDLHWDGGDGRRPFDVPEYDRLVYGLIALGFVFDEYDLKGMAGQVVNAASKRQQKI